METNEDQSEKADKPGEMTTEMQSAKELWDSGKFPMRDEDGDMYIPFFLFKFSYHLGPCSFDISKYYLWLI